MEEKKEEPTGSRRSLKTKRQLIQGIGWIIAIVLLITWISGQWWALALLIVYAPIFIFLKNRLPQWIFKTTTCYECGTAIDLIDRWQCGCGDITRRHVMSKCPSCKKWMTTFPCPSCETTLDV